MVFSDLPGCLRGAPGWCPVLPFYLHFFFNVFTLLSLLCCRNAEKILGYLNNDVLSRALIPPHVNFSHLTTKDYAEMYKVIKTVKEDHSSALGLDPCLLEDELDKVWGRLSFHGRAGRQMWECRAQRQAMGGWSLGAESHQGLILWLDKQGSTMCPE